MRKRHNVKNQIEDESRKKTEKSKKKIRHILEWLWAFIFVSNTRKKNGKKKVLDRFAFCASFRYILSSFFCFMERTLYVHVSLKFGCSFLFWHSCERCSGMEETVIPIFVLPYFFWIRATSRFIDMYSRLSIICFSMFFIHFVRVNANIRRYSSHSPVFSFAPIFNLSRWAYCFNR